MLSKIGINQLDGISKQIDRINIGENKLEQKAVKYLTARNKKFFDMRNWFLCNGTEYLEKGKFKENQWFQLMPLIIVIKECQQLHLFKNYESKIILSLSFTKFVSLKNLTLDYNEIKNIEALSFIDALNLNYLSLQNNLITNIQSLIKTSFQKIIVIQLYNNPINKVQSLSRLNYPNISQYYLFHLNPKIQSQQICPFLQDISIFLKIQHFQRLPKKRGFNVIQQKIVQDKIKQKIFTKKY